jgi:hypothetical protein
MKKPTGSLLQRYPQLESGRGGLRIILKDGNREARKTEPQGCEWPKHVTGFEEE